ncbi:phytanoyl-CoA dioxygenase family protein [Adhaeretor mobilis]|uniref:Phytanoyl-CoA dioxygenase (PhyH) n=1 Tax=Adhaeretor mobilis TaxID=1930276 RepID=A0A517MVC9_9BACT|nr:phytanoyl-CoA dioxygenase family protein [Adhaeretor mobilis]QDS98832.1 Phytanoyl-CoA dioxygenase (PhyH) [Adhaeretor mobilis]
MSIDSSYLKKHAARIKAEFELNGFVHIPRFATGAELETIQKNMQRVLQEVVPTMPATHVYYEDLADKTSLKQLQELYEYDAFFKSLMIDSRWQTLAEVCLGEAATPQNMQYFNKPPGASLPTPPHQDGFYFHVKPNHAITLWMALEEVEPEQGCVNYVQGSHKYGMRWHGQSNTLGFSQAMLDFGNHFDRTNTRSFPCQAGDLIAHHCLTIHWADGNHTSDKTRQALGWIYFGATCQEDAEKAASYKKQLDSQLMAAGKV